MQSRHSLMTGRLIVLRALLTIVRHSWRSPTSDTKNKKMPWLRGRGFD
jgi:hypothetical protein